jgi:WD40 repeat protein
MPTRPLLILAAARPWVCRAASLALMAAPAMLVPAAWCPPARAAGPAGFESTEHEAPTSPKPFLTIEAGMHTAIIRRIAVDRAGNWVVTASEDKTARVWNLTSAKLERVLRVPVGPGDEGKLYAVALSPDGALVALGGFTGPTGRPKSIYLFDRASGRLLQRLPGVPNVVNDLAFSADGTRLAAALGGNSGIRIYGTNGKSLWKQQASDENFGDLSDSVEFNIFGNLLASSWDGKLRIYATDATGTIQPLISRTALGGKNPFFARFSPDGLKIALYYSDSNQLELLDGRSLETLGTADTSLITSGDLSNVAWTANNELYLLAAGQHALENGQKSIPIWSLAGVPVQHQLLALKSRVTDLQPLPDGRLVYSAAAEHPAWGVLDPQQKEATSYNWPPGLRSHRDNSRRSKQREAKLLRLDNEGSRVLFTTILHEGGTTTSKAILFDLKNRKLVQLESRPPRTIPRPTYFRRTAFVTVGGKKRAISTFHPIEPSTQFDQSHRTNFAHLEINASNKYLRTTLVPVVSISPPSTKDCSNIADASILRLDKYEKCRSLAISSDGSRYALGSDWALRLYANGLRLWRISVPASAKMVTLSADDRFVLAALSDGTIRWYRSSDGSEALALYVHPDGQRWILWTPEGFYDASPGGAELFGYHLNNGRDQAGSFIRASQLQKKFFRPDLIARRLGGTAADEAAIASAVAEVGDVRTSLSTASLPPSLRLLSQRSLPDGDIEITYELNDQGGGLGPVELRLDGAVLEGRADPPVAGINRRRLRPPAGRSRLQLLAYSRSGVASTPVGLDLTATASGEPATLHLLAVGITNYRDGSLRRGVRFAAGDAVAFREALTASGRATTARVAEPVLLLDEQASGERIRRELHAMAQRVRPADLFVLYLAGHGVSTDQGEYVFLPQDLLYRNSETLAASGLGGDELRSLLARIPSTKTVVVLDTCSSGAFGLSGRSLGEKGAIDRLSRLSGRVVLAAAGDQRMALESPDNQRGIFTGALIEALSGKADSNGDGLVGVREVADYVEQEVQRITLELFKYEQTPMSDLRGQNFPLSKSGGRP